MKLEILNNKRVQKMVVAATLVLIMVAGLLVRLDDLRSWQQNPGRAFYAGEPLLTTFDGYFYLNLTRDLLENNYSEIDQNQVVPSGRVRPSPPPLLPVLGALATKITGFSLNWIGTVLPAVLGVLLALPLFFLGSHFGGAAMGSSAAITGLLFPYYVYRSNVGWYDTDCLNVTFATAFVYFLLKFAKENNRMRYVYFGAGIFVYLLYLWWWDQATQVVTVICISTMVIALVFFYRPERREGRFFYGGLATLSLLALLWDGGSLPLKIYHTFAGLFDYIHTSKQVAGVFPSASITVSEQVRPGFNEIVAKSTGSLPVFLSSSIGLLYLFYKKPKDSLFLIVPILMASMSFLFAKRFLIFLNPITALGLGSFIAFVWALKSRHKIAVLLAPLLLAVFIWPSLSGNLKRVHWPKEPSALVAGMVAAQKHTPEDAVVWTWWDHGYNMRYWADRGVISDGSYHGGNISLYNALPMAVDSERLASNFIQFYVAHGSNGMEEVYKKFDGDHSSAMKFLKSAFAAGPNGVERIIQRQAPPNNTDEWSEFLFPEKTRPTYLFLDWRLTITSYWWYWFGSWDFDKRDGYHPVFDMFHNVSIKNGVVNGRNNRGPFNADLQTGILKIGNRKMNAATISFIEPDGKIKVGKYKKNGLGLEISATKRAAALVDPAIAGSVFNRLYLRGQYDKKYFRLVAEEFPAWQLWEVTGDSL